MVRFVRFDSPIGPLLLASRETGVCLLHFVGETPAEGGAREWIAGLLPGSEVREDAGGPYLAEARDRIREYLENAVPIQHDPEIPLDLGAGTPFQRAVWRSLLAIPFGETRTYGHVAQSVGRPAASRAVGGACGRNPVAILVPCHRVIGSGGKLVGFGAGVEIKEKLLALERRGPIAT